ncbi:MAG: hypothetical protein JNM62_03330 [Flavobacteriales bacterium]|nr:hypothetical protein [Flavobacteriales bacterium]
MTSRRITLVAILLVTVAVGAMREFVFINLNYCIDHLANHRQVNYAHSLFRKAVEGLTLNSLVVLKWSFTIAFIGVMLGASVFTARLLFGDHRYARPIMWGFVVIAALALALHLAAQHVPALALASIKLIHLLQYPVLLFFLWAAALLRERTA